MCFRLAKVTMRLNKFTFREGYEKNSHSIVY